MGRTWELAGASSEASPAARATVPDHPHREAPDRAVAKRRADRRPDRSRSWRFPGRHCSGASATLLRVGPWLVLLAILGVVALFLDKAFTVDDTLFLSLARHVQDHPLDFFGFEVNWYGTASPMHEVTMNPPLAGHFSAAAAALVGWDEISLHGAFLLPAGLVILGTFMLARRFCSRPAEATVIALLSPAFLVSSTNVMADTLMLASWCWAVWLWVTGLDRDSHWRCLASAVLIILATLTKYFAISLVPLLLLYTLIRRRAGPTRLVILLLPLIALVLYDSYCHALYGHSMLLEAAGYSAARPGSADRGLATSFLIGLVFLGGCLLFGLFYSVLLWPRRVVLFGLFLVGVGVLFDQQVSSLFGIDREHAVSFQRLTMMQLLLMALGGASLVGVAFSSLGSRRTADDWLLLLWLAGTLLFAALVNWTSNGRSMLPLAPAAGILIIRRLDRLEQSGLVVRNGARRLLLPLPGIVVALLVAQGDFNWANAVRDAASDLHQRHADPRYDRLLAHGHWGLQFYLERLGGRVMDVRTDVVERGQILVTPTNNTNVFGMSQPLVERIDLLQVAEPRWVHTMRPSIQAGFYASNIGVLPYAFGIAVPDEYHVYRAKHRFRYAVAETALAR